MVNAAEGCPVVALYWYSDHSGIQVVLGPYPDEEAAHDAIASLRVLPLHDGQWDIRPLINMEVTGG